MQTDVFIAGASFAGLGLAYHLKDSGLKVLLADRKAIGDGRASTCGMPTKLAESLSPGAAYDSIEKVRIDMGWFKKELKIPEPYCVIDYKKFCNGLYKRSGARFAKAHVSKANDGVVETSEGQMKARFVADCTGWRRSLSVRSGSRPSKVFNGVEITAPIDSKYEGAFSFYFDKSLVPGYAWIFPIGKGLAHVGVGGFANGSKLNNALLRFIGRIGVEFTKEGLIGGAIPCVGIGEAVEDGIFFVGDSARQVLPLSGEGIRTTLFFSKLCAQSITKVSKGEATLKQGLDMYARGVRSHSLGYSSLNLLQEMLITMPQPVMEACFFGASLPVIDGFLMRAYTSTARYG